MLATEWVASKLVAIHPGSNASEWRPSNETGMNVKVAGTARANPMLSKFWPVIPFLCDVG
jgi:hypothetical protein